MIKPPNTISSRFDVTEVGTDQWNVDCNSPLNAGTKILSKIGSSVMNAAPRNDPRMLPSPPMITMNRMRNERSSVKASGSTVPR